MNVYACVTSKFVPMEKQVFSTDLLNTNEKFPRLYRERTGSIFVPKVIRPRLRYLSL